MVAAATIQIMKIVWVTYLGTLFASKRDNDTSNIGPSPKFGVM